MGSSGAVCGVGGWENTFGKDIPKKSFFFIPSLSFASLFPWCTVKNSIKSFCFFGNFLYGVNLCFGSCLFNLTLTVVNLRMVISIKNPK